MNENHSFIDKSGLKAFFSMIILKIYLLFYEILGLWLKTFADLIPKIPNYLGKKMIPEVSCVLLLKGKLLKGAIKILF